MKTNQQGATLIVVLMILLLIMVVGTLAIRQSVSSLKMVSNNQIQALLLQNSDAALMYFQNLNNMTSLAAADGVVGYLKNQSNNQELVTCFNKANPYLLLNMGLLNSGGTIDNQAACRGNDTSGGRKQVVTQVYIKKISSATSQPFADFARGTDVLTAKTENSIRLQITVISVMTGFNTADELTNCFNQTAAKTISCLNQMHALYNSQVAEYHFLSDFEPPK